MNSYAELTSVARNQSRKNEVVVLARFYLFVVALTMVHGFSENAEGQTAEVMGDGCEQFLEVLKVQNTDTLGSIDVLSRLMGGDKLTSKELTKNLPMAGEVGDSPKLAQGIESLQKSLKNLENQNAGVERSASNPCSSSSPEVLSLEGNYQQNRKRLLGLKLGFLQKAHLVRKAMIVTSLEDGGGDSIATEAIPSSLSTKIAAAERIAEEAGRAKAEAKQESLQAASRTEKILAGEKVKLEAYRETVAKVSSGWLEDERISVAEYEAKGNELADIEASFAANEKVAQQDLLILYNKTQVHWRSLVDEGFAMYGTALKERSLSSQIKDLPRKPGKLLAKIEDSERKDYLEAHRRAEAETLQLKEEQWERLERKLDKYFSVLGKASEVRASILGILDTSQVQEEGQAYVADLWREALAMPFRLFGFGLSKYLQIKADMESGLFGFWKLIKSLLIILCLCAVPFVALYFGRKATDSLDQYRAAVLKKRHGSRQFNLKVALWIQRFTPYTQWILYIFVLWMINGYLVETSFEQVRFFIPLLIYICLYRMFRLLVGDALVSLRRFTSIDRKDARPLIERTTKMVGLFFLISYIVMHLTEWSVNKGLIYTHLMGMMKILGLFVCAYAATKWKAILGPAVLELYPKKIGPYLSQKVTGRLAIFFCLPTFLLIVGKLMVRTVWAWVGEWEVSKKLLAKIYRKKVESMGAQVNKTTEEDLPESYRKIFSVDGLADDPRCLIEANKEQFELIKKEISGWQEDVEEDRSMVLYGEKGGGKTTLLGRIGEQFSDLNVIRLDIPPKITDVSALGEYLAGVFEGDPADNPVRTALEFNKKIEKKTLVLVDDAHNLFLGKYGGFEALKAFINVVNLNTENLFWCIVFNEFAWSYLKGVLGKSEYFRTEINLDSWTDDSIRELILNRHNSTEYKISYDKIILASMSNTSGADATEYAEEQFFRLLWEQCGGNPRVALYLWLNCLSVSGSGTFRVGLPERPKTEKLSDLDDVSWFSLAAVATHENATRKEIADSTNMSVAQVAHALKMGIESKILLKGTGNRYRISFGYQYDLIKQLKAKNFIYGLD